MFQQYGEQFKDFWSQNGVFRIQELMKNVKYYYYKWKSQIDSLMKNVS